MTRSPSSLLDDRILVLRGLRILLDADLAALYGVSTKAFNQAVKHSPAEPEPKVHHRLGRAVRFCCGGFRPHTP